MSGPAIEAVGLVKEFEKGRRTLLQRLRREPDRRERFRAVDGIDLHVERGEAPAIAVDSGAISAQSIADTKPLLIAGDTILVVFALRCAGVFIAAGTTRALRSGLMPRWFAAISYVLVLVLLLTVARARFVTLVFPAWVVAMSLLVLKRRVVTPTAGSAA